MIPYKHNIFQNLTPELKSHHYNNLPKSTETLTRLLRAQEVTDICIEKLISAIYAAENTIEETR